MEWKWGWVGFGWESGWKRFNLSLLIHLYSSNSFWREMEGSWIKAHDDVTSSQIRSSSSSEPGFFLLLRFLSLPLSLSLSVCRLQVLVFWRERPRFCSNDFFWCSDPRAKRWERGPSCMVQWWRDVLPISCRVLTYSGYGLWCVRLHPSGWIHGLLLFLKLKTWSWTERFSSPMIGQLVLWFVLHSVSLSLSLLMVKSRHSHTLYRCTHHFNLVSLSLTFGLHIDTLLLMYPHFILLVPFIPFSSSHPLTFSLLFLSSFPFRSRSRCILFIKSLPSSLKVSILDSWQASSLH